MVDLIDLEKRTEVEETGRLADRLSGTQMEARGLSILRLVAVDERAGLGGRILLTLERTDRGALPPGRIGPGDIVRLVPQGDRPRTGREAREHPSGVGGCLTSPLALDPFPCQDTLLVIVFDLHHLRHQVCRSDKLWRRIASGKDHLYAVRLAGYYPQHIL